MEKISWQTVEHIHTEKTADWYWIVGIVAISIALISVILNNIIFAILILVSSFTLALFASKRPKIITVELNSFSVIVDRTQYPYANLESFWVETREGYDRLLIKSKKLFMPLIVLQIEDEDHERIRAYLSQHLMEEELSEPLLEKVLIRLGF